VSGVARSETLKGSLRCAFKNHHLKFPALGKEGDKYGYVEKLPQARKRPHIAGRGVGVSPLVIHRRKVYPARLSYRQGIQQGLEAFDTKARVFKETPVRENRAHPTLPVYKLRERPLSNLDFLQVGERW